MNLSDLIVATPETPKGKSGLGDKAQDQAPQADGAGFLELTIGTSEAAPVGISAQAIEVSEQVSVSVSTLAARVLETELGSTGATQDTGASASVDLAGGTSLEATDATPIPPGNELVAESLLAVTDPSKVVITDAESTVSLTTQSDAKAAAGAVAEPVFAPGDTTKTVALISAETSQTTNAAQPVVEQAASAAVPKPAQLLVTPDQVSNPAPQQVQSTLQTSLAQQGPIAVAPQQRGISLENPSAERPTATSVDVSRQRPAISLDNGPTETVLRVSQSAAGAVEQVSQSLQTPPTGQTDLRAVQAFYSQGATQSAAGDAPVLVSQSSTSTATPTTTGSPVSGALASELSAQAAQRAILPQIVGSVQNLPGTGVIDLMLDPPELGRIEIVLELTDKSLRATLSADRTATDEMIRRQASELLQQFSDAGFGDVDLQFADQGGRGSDEADRDGLADRGLVDRVELETPPNRYTPVRADGRIDMRL